MTREDLARAEAAVRLLEQSELPDALRAAVGALRAHLDSITPERVLFERLGETGEVLRRVVTLLEVVEREQAAETKAEEQKVALATGILERVDWKTAAYAVAALASGGGMAEVARRMMSGEP